MTVWTGAIIVKSKTGENIIQLYISEKTYWKDNEFETNEQRWDNKEEGYEKKRILKKSYFVTSLLRWVVWKCLI